LQPEPDSDEETEEETEEEITETESEESEGEAAAAAERRVTRELKMLAAKLKSIKVISLIGSLDVSTLKFVVVTFDVAVSVRTQGDGGVIAMPILY
jgi:hypothetical protein